MLIYFLILFFSTDRNNYLFLSTSFFLSLKISWFYLLFLWVVCIYLNCCNDCIKSVWKFPSLISHSFLCFFLIYLQEQNFTFKSKLVILKIIKVFIISFTFLMHMIYLYIYMRLNVNWFISLYKKQNKTILKKINQRFGECQFSYIKRPVNVESHMYF